MINTIEVTNHVGDSITIDLRKPEKSGFLIKSITGIGPGKADITTTDNVTSDGATFNNSRMPSRNIVISIAYFAVGGSIEDVRLKSYKYFPLKRKVSLKITTDNRCVEIDGYVETNDPSIFSQEEGADISIICPDPLFYSAGPDGTTTTVFSGITPMFEFPFENDSLSEDTINMGEIILKTENIVTYAGDLETGIVITIHALGDANNITIYNIGTRESMSINTEILAEMTGAGFGTGDDIIVDTRKGHKTAVLVRNGTTTNILNCLGRYSSWFQLSKGDNLFAYTAEYGGSALQFKIENRIVYEGI